MCGGIIMNQNNDLGLAIQTSIIDPIKKSFAKQQESFSAIDKRLRVLTVIVVVNLLMTAGLISSIIIKLY